MLVKLPLSEGKQFSIIRICSKQFPRRIVPTIGVQFESTNLQVKNKNIHVSIWDTCNLFVMQPGKRSIMQLPRSIQSCYYRHYRKANGAIIVYDVTKKRSFLNCSKWLSCIKINIQRQSRKHLIISIFYCQVIRQTSVSIGRLKL